ncbi:MAG: BolA family transcriptional regulator [Burkholderia sp.]|nr:BolA family transcriptional regulator [Burkholderia sp.]
MSERMEQIRSRLLATFAPLDCQLMDESHLHAGHAGAASGGGHYRVQLVSDRFEGLNRVSRHRLVYDCLNDMMHADIHALAIIALAPSEVEK